MLDLSVFVVALSSKLVLTVLKNEKKKKDKCKWNPRSDGMISKKKKHENKV